MIRNHCLTLCLLASMSASAQQPDKPLRKFVVADIETRVPVRGAVVSTPDGYRDTTNYRGICYIPQTFDTLSVAKPGYLTERLIPKEVADSTYIIPDSRRLSEVTVWGKDRATLLQENVEKWTRQGETLPNTDGNGGSIGFDLARMLDKRYRRDQKNLRIVRQQFKKMDTYDEDPIVDAYKREMEKRRLAKERELKARELSEQQLQRQQEQAEARRQPSTPADAPATHQP